MCKNCDFLLHLDHHLSFHTLTKQQNMEQPRSSLSCISMEIWHLNDLHMNQAEHQWTLKWQSSGETCSSTLVFCFHFLVNQWSINYAEILYWPNRPMYQIWMSLNFKQRSYQCPFDILVQQLVKLGPKVLGKVLKLPVPAKMAHVRPSIHPSINSLSHFP